ncbi:MAG: F0F1 ATP synthase subunit epsilon [Betaproteobacteria bacterium]|nr:F0F1 ATP synthase subunit epsilon [Betaproteobacteria bacterium]
MKTFYLELLDSRGADRFPAVRQFVAADASGSFGILAGHEPMVAVLRYGLARFEDDSGQWHYAAMSGGTLRFAGNRLTVATVQHFLGLERGTLLQQLSAEMARTESDIARARATLTEIEHSLLRHLGDLMDPAFEGSLA